MDKPLCYYCLVALSRGYHANVEMRNPNNAPMNLPSLVARELLPWILSRLETGCWITIENNQSANLFAVTSWKNTPVCLGHAYNARVDTYAN